MISVIVPAYNIEGYIGRALESILAQSYSNIEIIVVDDGSTDSTAEVIDKYEKQYPEKVRAIHIANDGVTNARLTGIAEAKGEWVGFVDGDDEIEPDMYEFLLKNAITYGADISHCGYQMIFSDGRINYFYNTGNLVKQDKETALKDLLDGCFVEPGLCNKLFNKSLFKRLFQDELMDRSIRINEDLLMNFYLFSSANKSVFEDKCKYHYIVRESSASREKLKGHKIYDPIRVKEIILEQCDENIVSYAQKAFVTTCVYGYCNLVVNGDEEYLDAKQKIRGLIIQHFQWCSKLPKRTKLLAELIVKAPWLFQFVYKIYVHCLQKTKYE
ncbi:glycosyltransferase family 2 protein [Alloiococcus sp. CFN-8]|uniref:glycosyltransferase family 2 protein n=1 Tax=Alloiococcus sp. CFN-8 TaxID=3416081 RepID=UPI003CF77745